MCTDTCPCWSGLIEKEPEDGSLEEAIKDKLLKTPRATLQRVALWAGYKGIDEAYLNKFGRTRMFHEFNPEL